MNTLFPASKRKKPSIASIVIKILSKTWSLSLKTIHRLVVFEYHRKVSHQATHKALKKLVKEKILLKKKKLYSIRPEWLEELNEFASKTKQKYNCFKTRKKLEK